MAKSKKHRNKSTSTVSFLDKYEAIKKFGDTVGVPLQTAEEWKADQEGISYSYYLSEQVSNLVRFKTWKNNGRIPTFDVIVSVWEMDVRETMGKLKEIKPAIYESLLAGDSPQAAILLEVVNKKPSDEVQTIESDDYILGAISEMRSAIHTFEAYKADGKVMVSVDEMIEMHQEFLNSELEDLRRTQPALFNRAIEAEKLYSIKLVKQSSPA